MTTKWPPDWLKDIAPHDTLTAIGWRDCLSWACSEPRFLARFVADTGETWTPPNSPIAAMIDKATGADRAYLVRFIVWFNQNIWGDEGLPKAAASARAELAEEQERGN